MRTSLIVIAALLMAACRSQSQHLGHWIRHPLPSDHQLADNATITLHFTKDSQVVAAIVDTENKVKYPVYGSYALTDSRLRVHWLDNQETSFDPWVATLSISPDRNTLTITIDAEIYGFTFLPQDPYARYTTAPNAQPRHTIKPSKIDRLSTETD